MLKREGKIYSLNSLDDLLFYISKKNIISLNLNYPSLNNIELLRITINGYEESHRQNGILDEQFLEKINNLLDTFTIENVDNENLRTIKNYFAKTNMLMKQKIIEYVSKEDSI